MSVSSSGVELNIVIERNLLQNHYVNSYVKRRVTLLRISPAGAKLFHKSDFGHCRVRSVQWLNEQGALDDLLVSTMVDCCR